MLVLVQPITVVFLEFIMINKIVIIVLLISIGILYFFTNSAQKHYSVDVNDCKLSILDDYNAEYKKDGISLNPIKIGKQFYFINFFKDSNSSIYMNNLINKMKYDILNIRKLQNIDLYECENKNKNKIYYIVGKTFYISFVQYTKEAKKIISSCNESWKLKIPHKINEYMIGAVIKELNITRKEAIDYLKNRDKRIGHK